MNDKWIVKIDNVIRTSYGIVFQWSGNIGFGEYMLYEKDGKWYGESECMDRGDDKEFLKHLLNEFVEDIKIVG